MLYDDDDDEFMALDRYKITWVCVSSDPSLSVCPHKPKFFRPQ